MVGRLLHEFAVTIILAILFSGLVSVTLTPMLCARMLRDEGHAKHNAFYRWSENSLQLGAGAYDRSLDWSMRHKTRHPGAVLRSASAPAVFLFQIMPQDFLPPDDHGQLNASIQAANGTSFERMVAYGQQVSQIVKPIPMSPAPCWT